MKNNAMKSLGVIGTAVLSLIVGSAVSSEAQRAQQVQRFDDFAVGLIPNSRYRAQFGQEHKFHLSQATYGQDRRFEHGGYSFGFADEWPTNWLPTEDVFITQTNGWYYLCNRTYPGVAIPLSVAAKRDASIRPARTRAPKPSRAKSRASVSTRAG